MRSQKCLSRSETRAALLIFRSARKHKLVRRHWDLASCQVSLNFIQRLQRRSITCLSQSEADTAILYFGSARKHKLDWGCWVLLSCQVLLNSVQGFGLRGEVENASANRRPGLSSCFSIDPKTINLVDDVEFLLPVKFRWIPFSCCREVDVNARRRTDAMTMARLSLRLRWAKNKPKLDM